MANYIYRLNIFVPAALRDLANQIAGQLDPDSGGGDTFSVPLSPSGNDPVTYYGCSTAATEDMREAMLTALGGLAGSIYYRLSTPANEGGPFILQASSSLSVIGQINTSWGVTPIETWNRSLADAGLKRIEPPVWMPF